MHKPLRLLSVLPLFLLLADCTSSQAIDTATALISGEIAGASAAGWAPGVAYGDLALTAVSCVATEAASADSAAVKTLKITACAASVYASSPAANSADQSIVAGIDAAMAALLAGFGAPLPAVPAPASAIAAHAAVKTAFPGRVALRDGKPGLFERRALAAASRRALQAKK